MRVGSFFKTPLELGDQLSRAAAGGQAFAIGTAARDDRRKPRRLPLLLPGISRGTSVWA